MGRVDGIVAVALALSMAGCALRGTPKTVAVPPQPQPAEQTKPAPPPEPLSVPQTQVSLPPPQPVNLDALAAAVQAQPVEQPPAPKPVRRTTVTPPPKPEVVAPAAQPAAEPERPPIQEIVPEDERRRFQESAGAPKRGPRPVVEQATRHRLAT